MTDRYRNLALTLLLVATAISGCGLPASAPTPSNIEVRHDPSGEFYLVRVNANVLPYLAQPKQQALAFQGSGLGYSPSVAIRPGDVVELTVFESGGSSLFGSAVTVPGQSASARTPLPSQVVERDGRILVPFVGPIVVQGKTPLEVANIVEQALASQTVKPQVIVSVVSSGSNTASIGGDVNKTGPFPLTLRGERLLDAIAFAGGGRYPISETDIRVIRGRTGSTASLQAIVDNPSQNITVRPNDQIIAIHHPRTFTVLGASTRVAQYNFDTPNVTLAEAVARAGGSIDTIGDPGGVFLFRREPTATARKILAVAEPTGIETSSGSPPHGLIGPKTMMLYRVDLNTSDGYFLAQKIQIADGDVVLIANAEGAQLVKVLTVLRGVTGIFYDLSKSGGN